MNIEERLLSLDVFENNDYFKLYIDLIKSNLYTSRIKYVTQRHHIIPRKYYQINKIKVDNSKQNIVNLRYEDHIRAHYYLSKCSKPE